MMRSNKLLLGVVAAVAAIGVYWFLLLAPKREEAAGLAEQVTQKQGEIVQAEAALVGYRAAEQSYKVNYASVARLGKAVPADDDVRSLVVQLEDAASSSKVDFRSITVSGGGAPEPGTAATGKAPPPGSKTVGAAGFSGMPFTLEFTGSYLQLSKFFSHLERFVEVDDTGKLDVTGRLLRVESVQLLPSGGGHKNLTAEVSATTYLTPPAEGLTGGATAAAPATSTTVTGGATTPPVTPATSTGALR